MSQLPETIAPELPCHRCGYDLRAHPADGNCPECNASVAESRRVAAMPRRPTWQDSDPRWRRRMVAGAWVLVLLPLMDVLKTSGWASRLPVPAFFESRGMVRTLDGTLLGSMNLYQRFVFCIGVVLLFSKERGVRPGGINRVRRWGLMGSYLTFLLCLANLLFISALVLAGIAAVFLSMPPKYQPAVTQKLVHLSAGYIRYGAHPGNIADVAAVVFASITIVLACVALVEALRRSGPLWLAKSLVAPLVLFSLPIVVGIARYALGVTGIGSGDILDYHTYFRPDLLVNGVADLATTMVVPISIWVEIAKWCTIFAIAVWLTIAQASAWAHRD